MCQNSEETNNKIGDTEEDLHCLVSSVVEDGVPLAVCLRLVVLLGGRGLLTLSIRLLVCIGAQRTYGVVEF